MKKKILVVDDDPIVRTLLVKMLRVRDIEVIEADQGFLAAKIFEKEKREISLIVSDIQMPVMDGLQLLKRIRESSPVPFILFTGLSDVAEAKDAHKLGADDFIMKPIDKEVIKKIVSLFERAETGETRELANRIPTPDEYKKISIDTLVQNAAIPSDIYVRLSESKFVKVGRKGEKTPQERLKFYRDKNIDTLYVLTTEFGSYVETAAQTTHKAVQSPLIPKQTKIALIENATRMVVENAFSTDQLSKTSLTWSQTVLEDTIEFISKEPELLEQFIDLSKHSNHLYAQSLAVALYSVLVAKEHGWTAPQTITKVALGGLFHDIGKKELPPDLLSKPRKNQTPEDIRNLESHCDRGRDILLGMVHLPEEVALVALHHHESKNGTGYPRRIKGEQINPLARLVGVVDRFVSFILPAVPSEKALTAHEAIKKMQMFYEEDMDPAFFSALKSVVDFKEPAKKSAS